MSEAAKSESARGLLKDISVMAEHLESQRVVILKILQGLNRHCPACVQANELIADLITKGVKR